MYNILARISDTHELKNWNEPSYPFEGPWEPYVRDFDPTLNAHFLNFENTPSIELPEVQAEMLSIEPYPSMCNIKKWIHTDTTFFESIPSQLSLKDADGKNWVALYLYKKLKNSEGFEKTNSIGFSKGSQEIWHITQASFVSASNLSILKEHQDEYLNSHFPKGGDTYQLFNREYAWSPGYNSIFRELWIDHELASKKYHVVKESYEIPDYEHIEYDEEGIATIPYVTKEFEKRIPENTIHIDIMPSYSRLVWENQYDASQEEVIAFFVPCKKIIEHLKLEQKLSDGYYFTEDGELVCFDGNLNGICDGLLIREDYLNMFLKDNDLEIFWTSIGEKQFFTSDMSQEWSKWKGLYFLKNKNIVGDINQYKEKE